MRLHETVASVLEEASLFGGTHKCLTCLRRLFRADSKVGDLTLKARVGRERAALVLVVDRTEKRHSHERLDACRSLRLRVDDLPPKVRQAQSPAPDLDQSE